uniref:cyclic GMP-AMP phosphodiesterase SMPDL3A isoform X2 n=1 Tax=Myxine glutinosa TaxID=7769 RepID=UPI00358E9E22
MACRFLFVVLCLLRSGIGSTIRSEGFGQEEVQHGEGSFWHITDLHLDSSYQESAKPRNVCLTSLGLPVTDAGPFGSHLCDSPWKLVHSALEHMRSLLPLPDFLIWTGDSPPHLPPGDLSTAAVLDTMRNFTSVILAAFPNIPVFPALGNHDYWPQDQMPGNVCEVYSKVGQMWKMWLTDEALETFKRGGFYTQLVSWNRTQVSTPLRIVSLNTVLYYTPNRITAGLVDPGGQLAWLKGVLSAARRDGEKVYVIAHVPPGVDPWFNTTFYNPDTNKRYLSVLRAFVDVLVAQMYGHMHRDCFRVLRDTAGNAVGSVFLAPAITPWKMNNGKMALPLANNPGFRLYKYSLEDYGILDLWQYFLNLTDANLKGIADWRVEYKMAATYNLKDLRPHSLAQLAKRLEEPRGRAFTLYYKYFLVSFSHNLPCSDCCHWIQVCAVSFLDHTAYQRCLARHRQTQEIILGCSSLNHMSVSLKCIPTKQTHT